MIKNVFLIFFILSVHICYAQKGFIIRPIFEEFGRFSNYNMQYEKYHCRKPPNNPYFQFSKLPIVLPDNFSPLNIGIQIEKKINKKINICFGIQQDETTTGFIISGIQKTLYTYPANFTTYNDPIRFSYSGLLTTKYLMYVVFKDVFNKNRIINDTVNYYLSSKKLKFGLDIILGINYINTGGTSDGPMILESAENIILYDNSILDYTGGMYNTNKKWNIKFTTGVRLNLIKRNKDILTFSLYFDQGIRNLSYQSINATINKTINYNYIVSSNGTGIYFQISKPFYIKF